jgi:hypothetical protein
MDNSNTPIIDAIIVQYIPCSSRDSNGDYVSVGREIVARRVKPSSVWRNRTGKSLGRMSLEQARKRFDFRWNSKFYGNQRQSNLR